MVTLPNDPPKGTPNNPPYPLSPQGEALRPAVATIATEPASSSNPPPQSQPPDHQTDSEDEWEKDDMDDDDWEIEDKPSDVPAPLKPSIQQDPILQSQLPAALRAGPPPGVAIKKKSAENVQAIASQISLPVSSIAASSAFSSQVSLSKQPAPAPAPPQTNPFLQRQNTGERIFGVEKSPRWQGAKPVQVTYDDSGHGPVELPATQTPVTELSRMNFGPPSPHSAQPPLIPVETDEPRHDVKRHESSASSQWEPGFDISSMDARTSRAHRLPSDAIPTPTKSWQEQQEWDRQERERRDRDAALALERAQHEEQMRKAEEDYYKGEAAFRAQPDNAGPTLPPRRSQISETVSTSPAATAQVSNPARSTPRSQALEHYAIKQVRWFDAQIGRLRTSPVLIQNANGPCPLLALVNALVLSTPESASSGLVETLRTRERVSLELLLQSVFDELTSGTRGDLDSLPDVGELYTFLKELHTGMNVNPRFIFVPDRASREIHPAYRPTVAPGGFEETREMKLYGTFNVPLVHGWLPPRDSPTYVAFQRSAKTYEDAQNIQFHEEELDAKLNSHGLSMEEQQIFEDLTTIKSFLHMWPTQLTDYGLRTLHEHILPGSFCILFRNDHFSTLFKEPKADQLFTLVTDAGYATHDEIIWESLVDVNGKNTELFSGDFRPVSHNGPASSANGPLAGPRGSSLGASQNIQSMLDVGDESEWSTIERGRGRRIQQTQKSSNVSGPNQFEHLDPLDGRGSRSTRVEQEDHDLALAMQLQEEEDARARRDNEARQRDNVFEGQGRVHDPRITIPISGPGGPGPNRLPQPGRPAVPPRRNRDDEDLPPPTYEQAASRPAFVPSSHHPSSPSAPVPNPNISPWGRGSGTSGQGRGGPLGTGMARGRVSGRDDRDKCHVM